MQNMFKNVHSKRFLLTYLGLVALLLLFFLMLSEDPSPVESSTENESMLTLFEPPLEIPQLLGYDMDHQVFTNDTFAGKWSFIFFHSADCIDCEAILKVLSNLKAGLANRAVQVVLVESSTQHAEALFSVCQSYNLDAEVVTIAESDSDKKALLAFFTRSRAYQAQDLEHAVFLVNPKGMLTARFQAPFTSVLMRQSFIHIRSEYARQS